MGIPERFLNKTGTDKCFICQDSLCALVALVQTRSQVKRKELEDLEDGREKDHSTLGKGQESSTKLQEWWQGVKRKFQVSDGRCQVDPN